MMMKMMGVPETIDNLYANNLNSTPGLEDLPEIDGTLSEILSQMSKRSSSGQSGDQRCWSQESFGNASQISADKNNLNNAVSSIATPGEIDAARQSDLNKPNRRRDTSGARKASQPGERSSSRR